MLYELHNPSCLAISTVSGIMQPRKLDKRAGIKKLEKFEEDFLRYF
jgi:hypothetical protein